MVISNHEYSTTSLNDQSKYVSLSMSVKKDPLQQRNGS